MHDGRCRVAGVGHLHADTLSGLNALLKLFPKRLHALPGFPKVADDPLRAAQGNPSAIARLLRSIGSRDKDRGEPSWAALGVMVEEVTLTQLVHRADFMANHWSVSLDEFVPQAKALLGDHPYAGIIDAFAADGAKGQRVPASLANINVRDATLGMWQLLHAMPDGPSRQAFERAEAHLDDTEIDLANALNFNLSHDWLSFVAHKLLRIAPLSSPAARLLANEPALGAEPRAILERDFGTCQNVLSALASVDKAQGRLPEAKRRLEKLVGLYPEGSSLDLLADVCEAAGDRDGMIAALARVLTLPDTGLAHAQAGVRIADAYMATGEWKKAEPYAVEAAESWAEWAMACAARCFAGEGDWDKADLWKSRIAERYEGSRLTYYLWCRWSGHGDAAKAASLVEPQVRAWSAEGESVDHLEAAAVFSLARGDDKSARSLYARAFALSNNPYDGLFVALLATDDAPARAAALQRIREHGREFEYDGERRETLCQLALLYERVVVKKEVEPGAAAALVKEVTSKGQPKERENAAYFAWRILQALGQDEAARPYLERCAASTNDVKWTVQLARMSKLGAKPR